MSSSNFASWPVSQETGKVVWYFHLFKNFPQFVEIHIVKGFSIANKAEIDVILELSCFVNDPANVGILISGSSAFCKTARTSESSRFMYYWSLAWRILSIALLVCEMDAIVRWFEHSLALPFFGIGMKTDLFQSFSHCWVFQIFWHIEWSSSTASLKGGKIPKQTFL